MPRRKGKMFATKKDVKRVERKLQGEVKTFLTSTTSSVITDLATTPIRNPIPLIVQGSGNSSREGDRIKVVRFDMRALITQDVAIPATFVRIVIFKDTQNLGALPTFNDLLNTTTATQNLVTHFDIQNRSRFKVIYNKAFALTVADKIEIPLHFSKKQNYTIKYKSNTGGVADLNGSGYFFYAWSDQAVTANPPSLTYSIKVSYVDN